MITTVRKVLALTRARWLAASSYRLNHVLSLVMQLFTIVPLFFVSRPLQPVMAGAIRGEGGQAFGFLIVGSAVTLVVIAAVNALPEAIQSGLSNGTLEALLGTPTPLPTLLAGLAGYELSWTTCRVLVMLLIASALGANIVWSGLPAGLVVLALIVLAYLPVAIVSSALFLAFRTTGPIGAAVLTLSALLGGVYYPTSSIPSWLRGVSAVLPLTYGLRALRRVLLQERSLLEVGGDVAVLAGFVVVSMAVSLATFAGALRYARRSGGLAQD